MEEQWMKKFSCEFQSGNSNIILLENDVSSYINQKWYPFFRQDLDIFIGIYVTFNRHKVIYVNWRPLLQSTQNQNSFIGQPLNISSFHSAT